MTARSALAPSAARALKAARQALPELHVQRRVEAPGLPSLVQMRQWLAAALQAAAEKPASARLTLRIIGRSEMARLNRTYRAKSGATNILSFPALPDAALPAELQATWREEMGLGDLVLCWPVVQAEAKAQGKSIVAHLAHLLVHGALHLLGYDHMSAHEAAAMETQEIRVLKRVGFSDPYADS